jgi:UDP-N-acetylenolpyruvoylglucosamine reductase
MVRMVVLTTNQAISFGLDAAAGLPAPAGGAARRPAGTGGSS